MNNFTFYSPTEFVFGKDTELRTGKLCKEHGATKVMIVYGGGSVVQSGLLDRVMKSLESENISFITFGGIQPNPVDTNVYEGITLAKNENVDFLLSVGGGSVIDTVKAIAAGVPYDGGNKQRSGLRRKRPSNTELRPNQGHSYNKPPGWPENSAQAL